MKLKNPIYLIFFTLLAVLGTSTLANAAPVQLGYHLKQGDAYELTLTVDQDITQSPMGQEKQEIKQSFLIGYRLDVLKTDTEGNTTTKITYTRMAMKNETPMGTVEVDTNDPSKEAPPPLKFLMGIKGQSFEMTFTPQGKVSNVKGIDTLMNALCSQAGEMEPQMKEMICKQLESQFGEAAVIESLEQAMAIYPDQAVSEGGSWSQTFEISNNCPMTLKKNSTLKKLDNATVEIEVLSNITTPLDLKPMDAGPLKIKCELKGTGKGIVMIDRTNGWIKSGTTTLDINGTMTTLPNDFMPEEETWPITLKIKTTIEAKKL